VDVMSIGEFARLSRLSAKALRLYDELGLLPPARVDPDSGYRWYAAGQLDNARLVASLRQIGVPLAQIQLILSLEPEAAAAQVGAYWSGAEADHAARRDLAGYLVDRLTGKRNVMYEVKVRDIPARSLLCLLRHASNHQEVWAMGKEVIGMLKAQPVPVPRIEGVAGAAFLVYYGEVNQDSDGPVEFCWPVPQDLAGQLAASFPALTLRTEPAHQEAYIHLGEDPQTAAQPQLLDDTFRAWAAEQQRQPSDLPLRVTLLTTTAPVTDASRRGGSDFAVPLRDRAGAA
jgi:DNA-binding transcriptional MerR regulator